MQTYAEASQHKKQQVSAAFSGRPAKRGPAYYYEDNRAQAVAQRRHVNAVAEKQAVVQKKTNRTGLPDQLKSGIENLSGYSMDDVKVHYNSAKPAQLQAHAYAQGTDIHIASGQEKHLPHEAWHIVQQKQGRVMPTMQLKGKVNVNDDKGLEKEADVMGEKSMQSGSRYSQTLSAIPIRSVRNPAALDDTAQLQLTEKQAAKIHAIFSGAYDTKTFKRKPFSADDRLEAWLQQAEAEAKVMGETYDPAAAKRSIEEMGYTVAGIHLRHVIPYSDIAGIMHVATSDKTRTAVSEAYQQQIREQVGKLIELIGSDESKDRWEEHSSASRLLLTSKKREAMGNIYRDLAHSQKNLFQGSGAANMAISNRPDFSVFGGGVLGEEQMNEFLWWWYDTMSLLELNPKESKENIFDVKANAYKQANLHSHKLSRPLGVLRGDGDELGGIINDEPEPQTWWQWITSFCYGYSSDSKDS